VTELVKKHLTCPQRKRELGPTGRCSNANPAIKEMGSGQFFIFMEAWLQWHMNRGKLASCLRLAP
jgi:hypothetical protein